MSRETKPNNQSNNGMFPTRTVAMIQDFFFLIYQYNATHDDGNINYIPVQAAADIERERERGREKKQ